MRVDVNVEPCESVVVSVTTLNGALGSWLNDAEVLVTVVTCPSELVEVKVVTPEGEGLVKVEVMVPVVTCPFELVEVKVITPEGEGLVKVEVMVPVVTCPCELVEVKVIVVEPDAGALSS